MGCHGRPVRAAMGRNGTSSTLWTPGAFRGLWDAMEHYALLKHGAIGHSGMQWDATIRLGAMAIRGIPWILVSNPPTPPPRIPTDKNTPKILL